jgi:Domain of unknown function (DUF4357)
MICGVQEMKNTKGLPVTDCSRFVIIHRKGARALLEVKEGKFVVMEGSTAFRDTYSGMTSYVKLKDSLIVNGALVEEGSLFRFSRDVQFDSISAAANVVLDRNSNGNKEWRHEQSKQCYGEWLKANKDTHSKE